LLPGTEITVDLSLVLSCLFFLYFKNLCLSNNDSDYFVVIIFVNQGAELIKMFNPGNGKPISKTEELEYTE
jgi:hypothetical protein